MSARIRGALILGFVAKAVAVSIGLKPRRDIPDGADVGGERRLVAHRERRSLVKVKGVRPIACAVRTYTGRGANPDEIAGVHFHLCREGVEAASSRDRLQRAAISWRAGEAAPTSSSAGTAQDPFVASTVRTRARKAWKAAGLEPIGLHECRHTFASLMIAAGENPKAVQEFLGHATITMTFDRYGHLMPGSRDQARARVDAYLADSHDRQGEVVAGLIPGAGVFAGRGELHPGLIWA